MRSSIKVSNLRIAFISLCGGILFWVVFGYITVANLTDEAEKAARLVELNNTQIETVQSVLVESVGQSDVKDSFLKDSAKSLKLVHSEILSLLADDELKAFYFSANKGFSEEFHEFVHAVGDSSFVLAPDLGLIRRVGSRLSDASKLMVQRGLAHTQELKSRESFIWSGVAVTFSVLLGFVVVPVIRKSEVNERALREERNRFRQYINLSSDAITIIDPADGSLVAYSALAKDLLGYSDDEMKTLNVLDWDHNIESISWLSDRLSELGDKVEVHERVHTRKDGSEYIGSVTVKRVQVGDQVLLSSAIRDITAQRELEAQREKEKPSLQSITDHSLDSIITIDGTGEVTFWNPAAERMFGYTFNEAMGRQLHDLITPVRFRSRAREGLANFEETGRGPAIGKQIDLMALHRDGTEFPIDLIISPVLVSNQWHALGIIRDVTEKKAVEDLIRKQKEELEVIFDTSLQGIVVMDANSRVVKANRQYCRLTGFGEDELIGLDWCGLCVDGSDKDRELVGRVIGGEAVMNHERTINTKSGEHRRVSVSLAMLPNQENVLATVSDITERYDLLKEIERRSITDELTRLQNRRGFKERLERVVDEYRHKHEPWSVLLLDVDHFKSVNDTYGHQVGDDVLASLGGVITNCCDEHAYPFRYGGEEFTVILKGRDRDGAIEFAEALRLAVERDVNVINDRVITISIGVSEFGINDNSDTVVKRADDNLYKAKESGRNRVV